MLFELMLSMGCVTCGEGTLMVDGECVPQGEGGGGTSGDDTGDDPSVDGDGDGFAEDDCDDSDPEVHPDAEEICGNGVDDNCNGSLDGCGGWEGSAAASELGFSIDGVGGALGFDVEVGDFDGDGRTDLVAGAPYAGGYIEGGGQVELILGPVAEGGSVGGLSSATLQGRTRDGYFGRDMAVADWDGDGDDDLAVAAPEGGFLSSSRGQGAVYLFSTPAGDLSDEDADAAWLGSTVEDGAGIALDRVPDTDGDGLPDLVVGAWGNGALYEYFGGAAFVVTSPLEGGGSLEGATGRYYGGRGNGGGVAMGGSVTGGDFDGDGLGDIAVSAYGHYKGEGDAQGGAVYAWFGPLDAIGSVDDSDALLWMPYSRYALPGEDPRQDEAGDLDGDGVDDLLIGTPGWQSSLGAVHIFSGESVDGERSMTLADARIEGVATEERLGSGVRIAGDQDGDGSVDLLVGAYTNSEWFSTSGMAYLMPGGFSGTTTVDDAMVEIHGIAQHDQLGSGMAVGDLTGDGPADLVLSTRGGGDWGGQVWILPASGI